MGRYHRFGERMVFTLVVFLFAATNPLIAQPDLLPWRDGKTLPALIEHLENWLDDHSDLERRDTLPDIHWIGLAQASYLQYGSQASTTGTIRGLYNADAQTIYLVRPWDHRNPHDVSVLLHELVHHRQAKDGYWYCPGAQELDAYRLQDNWLSQMGLEADVNWIAVILEAGCTPRDIHPD